MNRRLFLGFAVGGIGVTAGCTLPGDTNSAGSTDTANSDGISDTNDVSGSNGSSDNDEVAAEHATIQRLSLVNDRDDPAIMDLRIERDDIDEIVHEDEYELPAGLDGTVVDCVWPDKPLKVMTRDGDSGEWNSITTSDEMGCLSVLAEIHEQGTSFYTSNEECPIRSPDCHTNTGEET